MTSKYLEMLNYYLKLQQNESEKSNFISLMRLLFALVGFVSIYNFFQNFQNIWLIIFITSIVIVLILIKVHSVVIKNERFYSCLKKINEEENEYIQNGYLPFDNGEEYNLTSNSFTRDIDIFGEGSLFQHLNRTQTFMGKETLSKLLLTGLNTNKILLYHEAIQELEKKLDWRQKFRAVGMLYSENKESYFRLIEWSSTDENQLVKLPKILYYVLPTILCTTLILFLISRSSILVIVSSILFVTNLLVFIISYKDIQSKLILAEKAYSSIEKYSNLIQMIELEEFSNSVLLELKLNLNSDKIEASKCVKHLGRILERLETINNLWGVILLNGFFLYHLHALLSLSKWKSNYSYRVKIFLNTVGEFDALVSLANFAFNNPQFTYPKINYEANLSFKGLSHPLIRAGMRACSDVSFENQKFILLTGSNMSGKSTFLRTLGINIILAKAGLPVCASEANVFPFQILSCMRNTDSLQENKSYFLAELKSLKFIIDSLQEGS